MSNPATSQPERSNEEEATTSVIKELLLELLDPFKNYGYLFLLTITGIVLKPRVVVHSILMPPPEQAKSRKGLLNTTTDWWKSSWNDKNNSFDKWFTVNRNKKYYNPISFLVAILALQLALTSLLSLKEVPASKSYVSYMQVGYKLLASKPVQKAVELGLISAQTVQEEQASLITSIEENKKRVEQVEGLTKMDYLNKVMRLFIIVVMLTVFVRMMHKAFDVLPTVELFIYGVYMNSVVLMAMFWVNSIITVMSDKYACLSDLSFIFFFVLLPIYLYSVYINRNFGLSRRAKKRGIALRYFASLAIAAFSFNILLVTLTYLAEHTIDLLKSCFS